MKISVSQIKMWTENLGSKQHQSEERLSGDYNGAEMLEHPDRIT